MPAVATIGQLIALLTADLVTGYSIFVQGFYNPGDGGGGTFRWDGASADAAITGFVLPTAAGGAGRWKRAYEGAINDRMAGAVVDGVTPDDAALGALAAYVAYEPKARWIEFVPGTRRVLPAHAPAAMTCFAIVGIDGLTIDWGGAVFATARTFAESVKTGNSTVFRFSSCQSVTALGVAQFIGPLTKADIAAAASAHGNVAMVFEGNCSDARAQLDIAGMLEGVLCTRAPRITLDPARPPRIARGGAGYAVNDVLTLANIGSVATTHATLTVASVNAGAVTGVTVTAPGVFPNFFKGTVAEAATGCTVTGGTGSNCTVNPYTLDYDDAQYADMMRGFDFRVTGSLCFYGVNLQWNGCDGRFFVDVDVCYRTFFVYGVTGVEFDAVIRDQHQRAFVASIAGLRTQVRGRVTIRPTREETFSQTSTAVSIGFFSAVPGIVKADIDFAGSRLGGANCGSYLIVEKFAQGANDWVYARGHELDLVIGGSIAGAGVSDSGAGANIMGTNINPSDASWLGEQFAIRLKDGFQVRFCGARGLVFNANAIARGLTIGNVDMDCPILIAAGGGGTPTTSIASVGVVKVAVGAVFANRWNNISNVDGRGTGHDVAD